MNLNLNELQRFVNGQVEIRNPRNKIIYVGSIKEINIGDNFLFISFSWFAFGILSPDKVKVWRKDEKCLHVVNLNLFSRGVSGPEQNDKLKIVSAIQGTIEFIGPNSPNLLKKDLVEGL